jgi:tRNA dimethylallyltransferase
MKKRVLVIVGPTASGKSDLGVKLARKFNGEIISADSRQVYKGLDIGTGKITRSEMRGVAHHLLDVASPTKQFTVSDYKKLGENALKKIFDKKKLPIVVGGTGFYVDTLLSKTPLPEVPPNNALRRKLSKKSAAELFRILKKKDPRRARAIDPENKVRLIRALEIVEALGKVPPLHVRTSNNRGTYLITYIGLKPDDLDMRIHKRLLKRLPGMIREAKRLHTQGLSYKRMHELGLEYRYLALLLQKKISKKEFIEKLNTEIRHYAKRQMTWFKRNKKIRWFTLSGVEGFKPKEYKEILRYLGGR